MNKKVLLLGGLGVIGTILQNGLDKNKYDIHVADVYDEEVTNKNNYMRIDINSLSDLEKKIPENLDVLVNLTGMSEMEKIVDAKNATEMIDLYVKGQYNLFLVASTKGVKRVIFASSNHVTDFYENNGYSLLNREISTTDHPASTSLYGILKLAAENIGFLFSNQYGISVINFRLGTVRANDIEDVKKSDRFSRTMLYNNDLIDIFQCALDTDKKFGTYYAVSCNKDKPWDINNAIIDLGYKPQRRQEN